MNVAQAGRDIDPISDRKRQPVGLPGSVVRILAQDHRPSVGVGREMQRTEHLVVWRIHRVRSPFGGNERLQLPPVGEIELCAQNGVPVGSGRHRSPN